MIRSVSSGLAKSVFASPAASKLKSQLQSQGANLNSQMQCRSSLKSGNSSNLSSMNNDTSQKPRSRRQEPPYQNLIHLLSGK